jgi:hypothetical protein
MFPRQRLDAIVETPTDTKAIKPQPERNGIMYAVRVEML